MKLVVLTEPEVGEPIAYGTFRSWRAAFSLIDWLNSEGTAATAYEVNEWPPADRVANG